MDLPTPERIGRYAIFEKIASGGMASVHFARLLDPSGFARTVAVKRAHPHLAQEREFALMFLDEARLAARIRHPNVVSTIDVLQTPRDLLLVMEYVHGESLWRLGRVARTLNERAPVSIAASIIGDALHGLHAAHEARDEQGHPLGIVHRDVSPQNILVGADGITRLVDFGIAKASGRLHSTKDSAVKGKFGYMAPEQVRGENLTRLADVYSASIVFWELLTGESLFTGPTDAETIHKCLVGRIDPPSRLVPDLPSRIDAIVQRGLCRDPDGRYPTAREMAMEIEAAVPLVRPSDIGQWVERMAHASLSARAAVLAAMERTDVRAVDDTPRPNPMPEAISGETPKAPPNTDVPVDVHVEPAAITVRTAPSSRRLSTGRMLVLAGALAIAATGLVAVRIATTQKPVREAATAASAVETLAPLAEPADPPKVTTPLPAVAATSSTSSSSAPGKGLARPVPPPRAPPSDAKGGRKQHVKNCDPPYSVDAEGRQIFKPECM